MRLSLQAVASNPRAADVGRAVPPSGHHRPHSGRTPMRTSSLGTLHRDSGWRWREGRSEERIRCRAEEEGGGGGPRATKLAALVQRKHRELSTLLQEMGEEMVEERMQSAVQNPYEPRFYLAQALSAPRLQGMPAIILEVSRPEGSSVVERALQFEAAGAEAIAVKTDKDDTPQGLLDLFEVCRAVKRLPVLRRELMLHPMQVVETKEAGAAGAIGVVTSVLGKGTPTMTQFAAAIGLDTPVEVVNMDEMSKVEKFGVPLYGINLSVGLSVQIPGFRDSVMQGLIESAPFGCLTIVGARDQAEAESAVRAKADAVYLKWEMLNGKSQAEVRDLVAWLKYIGSGDD